MSSFRFPKTSLEITDSSSLCSNASQLVRLALEAGLCSANTSFGNFRSRSSLNAQYLVERDDVLALQDDERSSVAEADIVNFTVMENEPAQLAALETAWSLTRKVLIVSAGVQVGKYVLRGHQATRSDSSRNYMSPIAFKEYIEKHLVADVIPGGLGIYFIFRDKTQAQSFKALHFRRQRLNYPQVGNHIEQFKKYQESLVPLMVFVAKHGRLPVEGEMTTEQEIASKFGSLSQAFEVITQATGLQAWQALKQKRREELLLYLAYNLFTGCQAVESIPLEIQRDIEALFNSYQEARQAATCMLLQLNESGTIDKLCRLSKVGKRLPDALYVHSWALEDLDPLLRLYESCATQNTGPIDGATLVKFQVGKPKISYLFYPDFDTDPHPSLQGSLQINWENLELSYRDYSTSANPPILHRKETFITPSYPLYGQFAELTRNEEEWGLLDYPRSIGTRNGWTQRLREKSVEVRDHCIAKLPESKVPKK